MERPSRTIAVAALASAMVAGFTVPAGAAMRGTNLCRKTLQAMLRSCEAGARSDNWIALGKCDNLPDPAARKTCADQASADVKDAIQECKDQQDARQTACDRLGPAPYDPTIDLANFTTSTTIDNSFFPLVPGTTFIYETPDHFEVDEFAVTHNTKTILGITCIEVHDTVKDNDELVEDTLDWFAQDNAGNVWYFGENSQQLAGGLVVGVEGSWTAGVDGAKPGIIMEAHPAITDFYRQEFALGTAEDLADVISLTEAATVPAGSFTDCLETEETTPLEPGAIEHKFYKAGVGNVLTQDIAPAGPPLELKQVIPPS